jgi:hypothetical protein
VRAGLAPERWLRNDLARHSRHKGVLAYWHHPPFSSGQSGGYIPIYRALWKRLHEARADVLLVSHDHVYERFAPQDAAGMPKATGVREFVVGTGGKDLGQFDFSRRNSQKRLRAFGVLRLSLDAASYRWSFVRAGDGAALDRGSTRCV